MIAAVPSLLDCFLLAAGGLLAGALGGLLGLGGGIVLMPLLRFGIGLSPARAAGTCILAVLFTSTGGTCRHVRRGNLHVPSLLPVVLSGVLAAALSSAAFGALARRGRWLDLGIGIVFLLVAARMLHTAFAGRGGARGGKPSGNRLPGTPLSKAGIGVAAGTLPGLLGIGTGGILVPAFTFLLHAPLKTAMAASLACFAATALVSSAFKIAQGYTDLGIALPLCLGTWLGAYLGATLNRRFPAGGLAVLFGALFLYVSAKFLLLSFGVRV